MLETLTTWLVDHGLKHVLAVLIVRASLVAAVILLSYIANFLAKRLLLRGLGRLIKRTDTKWDDVLLEKKVFDRLSHLAPALVIYNMADFALAGAPDLIGLAEAGALIYMIIVGLLVIDSLLSSLLSIYRTFEISHRVPIKGFVQVAKVILFFVGVILILSIILDKRPGILLGGLGALTAVLMLIFKDAILGFVSGIQLTTNDMVRRGDWLEMPKYGADGDVIDISLTTVKVQNWDKTISTVPTYALMTESFKNWRGMSESGGRRIKRAFNIDTTSIKFCTDQMLQRFSKIHYLTEYIEAKKKELAEYNAEHNIDNSVLINGRRMTNIGTFRAYIVAYLRNHPKIHQQMTFLIRHLAPTASGLPIEIYVFSNDQDWANYEAIQADIFDHILAVVSQFDLRIFQNPTGSDFKQLLNVANAS